jgi:predicted Zn-dependent peptidase
MGDLRDLGTMAMIAHVLGGGEKSRLQTALGARAKSVKVDWMAFKGPGALVIQVAAPAASTMEIEKVVRDALGDLRDNPVSLDEHARAANAIVRGYQDMNDTLAEQAATLGYFSTVGGSPNLARIYPEVVRQVSRNDMLDAAQKYLTPDAVKVVVLTP